MPAPDWNDLRPLLAVAREGTLAAAARSLGVDETTVARRLAALEAALGTRLFERMRGAALKPTEAGTTALARAEAVEREIARLVEGVAGRDEAAAGTVRLTAVPLLVNHLLIPGAAALGARHPRIALELIAESRELSLTKREADLALRLARPKGAGAAGVLARRLGQLDYAVYVPAACARADEARLAWIGYEPALAHLPPARWLAAQTPRAPLAVNDAEGILAALRAGLGRSLLPTRVGDADAALRRAGAPVLAREVWLLVHRDLRRLARIEAVIAWLETLLAPRSSPPRGRASRR
jgi:DNA-binding transcriptional LysR family regulator